MPGAPQPRIESLSVRAFWDGTAASAVDAEITFVVHAMTGSRLRLVDRYLPLEILDVTQQTAPKAVEEANETATKEKSSLPHTFSPNKTAEESSDELSEVAGRVFQHVIGNSISEESKPFESKIPVLTSKTVSVSPRKLPLPITKRPLFQSPSAEDTTRKGRRMLGTDTLRRRLSWSGSSSVMSLRTGSAGLGDSGDATRSQGRNMVRGHFARKSSVHEISAAKVQKWLGQDENRKPKWHSEDENQAEKWLGQHEHKDDNTFAPLYPNPLLIRGGGSFEGISGELTTFSSTRNLVDFHCSETVCIRCRVAVRPKEDQEKGGWFLLGLSLPAQHGLEATVDLKISKPEDDEEDIEEGKAYAWAEKFAYIDNDGRQIQFQGDLRTILDLGQPLAAMKILIFEPVRTLSSTDFEIDSDLWAEIDSSDIDESARNNADKDDMLTLKYTMLCSLRMRPVLFYADFLKFTIYLSGGPSGTTIELELRPNINNRGARPGLENGDVQVLHFESVTSSVENGTPMTITLTEAVLDFSTPFCIVFDKVLQLSSHSARLPKVSATAFRADLPCTPMPRRRIDWAKAARLPTTPHTEETSPSPDAGQVEGLGDEALDEQVPEHNGWRWEMLPLFLLIVWWVLQLTDGWRVLAA